MRRIAGLSKKQLRKKLAAKVRKAPPKKTARRAKRKPMAPAYCPDLFNRIFKDIGPTDL